MTPFIILLFAVMFGLAAVAYLLAADTKKETNADEWGALPSFVEVDAPVATPVGEEAEPGSVKEAKWSVFLIKDEFDDVKHEINNFSKNYAEEPGKGEAIKGFFSRVGYSIRLTFKEKEIITFAVLQWTAIAVGYYLWVQMLGWIPEEVWQSAAESDEGSIADVILFAWSFVCVGVAAFPLSIFSACMGAVHFLNRQGKPSSIAACLKIVLPKAWALWIFHWIDGWITVNQILKRLPKKNDRTTPAERAFSEALYYAWKLGTIGILPSLVTGRGMIESCKQSVLVVKHKFKEVATLRLGYSVLCWVVGILGYVGTFFFFIVFNDLVPAGENEVYGNVYKFYFWAAVPILISVAFVQLFLRPVYIISACDIYSDYLVERQEKVMLPRAPSKGTSAFVVFFVLCAVMAVVFLYRHQLGIMDMLATPYGTQ